LVISTSPPDSTLVAVGEFAGVGYGAVEFVQICRAIIGQAQNPGAVCDVEPIEL
jgi:hypothetical protein